MIRYEEKLFHKIEIKFMTKEEKELFTRIISAGPMLIFRVCDDILNSENILRYVIICNHCILFNAS